MKSKLMFHILAGLLILSLMMGCKASPPPTSPTLTFTTNKCNYGGPTSLSGAFTFNIVLPSKNPLEAGYALVTLHNGKTFADLVAYKSTTPPDWLTDLDDQGYLAQSQSFNYDTAKLGLHAGDQMYLVCF
ncbi:MAG: hypothetical protein ABSF99_03370, partial [Anaerolineales bacterium]